MTKALGFIYALVDPIDPSHVRYIGQSRSRSRLYGHIKEARAGRDRTHKGNWIRRVLGDGRRVEMVKLQDGGTLEELNALEARFIAEYRREGHRLTNSTDGGDGTPGYCHTDATKARLSAAMRGVPARPFSEAHRANLSAALKGKPRKPMSETERARVSAFFKGRRQSEEHRAKRATAQRGKKPGPLSEEHRLKISAAHKGRPKSAETRARMAAAMHRRMADPMAREALRRGRNAARAAAL